MGPGSPPPPHSPSEGRSAPPQGVKEGDRWVPEERRRSAPLPVQSGAGHAVLLRGCVAL